MPEGLLDFPPARTSLLDPVPQRGTGLLPPLASPTVEPLETRGATPEEIDARSQRKEEFFSDNLLSRAAIGHEMISQGFSFSDIPPKYALPWVLMNATGMAGPVRAMLAARVGAGGVPVAAKAALDKAAKTLKVPPEQLDKLFASAKGGHRPVTGGELSKTGPGVIPEEMSAQIVPTGDMLRRRTVKPEQLQGSVLLPAVGDRTAAGRTRRRRENRI